MVAVFDYRENNQRTERVFVTEFGPPPRLLLLLQSLTTTEETRKNKEAAIPFCQVLPLSFFLNL